MSKINGISIVIPCFNEEKSIENTIKQLIKTFDESGFSYEIIIVNDSSTDNTLEILNKIKSNKISIISNEYNSGYGYSLKVGIKKSKYDYIAITDADDTYPIQDFKNFFEYINNFDMIIGIRTKKGSKIPLLRRPAKWFLNKFSSFIAKRKIRDVNSGMRIFKKELALKYWKLFPDGFSFTTTITLSSIIGKHRIKEIEIKYNKRRGKSKIHPIKDTYNFIMLILRIAMLFNPLRIFVPVFMLFSFFTSISIARDIYNLNLSDTTVILFIFSILMLMMGLIADLIIKTLDIFD